MARKNKRIKTEYHRGLGFDPRKYISAPIHTRLKRDDSTDNRTPQRGEIWFAELAGHPNSSVQNGVRPVVIISNNIGNTHADTVNIVPLTRHLKRPELPCHTELNPDSVTDKRQFLDVSMVLAEQIATISKYALRNYVGKITDSVVLSEIEKAISVQLGFIIKEEIKCL